MVENDPLANILKGNCWCVAISKDESRAVIAYYTPNKVAVYNIKENIIERTFENCFKNYINSVYLVEETHEMFIVVTTRDKDLCVFQIDRPEILVRIHLKSEAPNIS